MRFSILIVLLLVISISDAQSLKVMTYNIRYDNPGDGVNAWPNRIEKVSALIRKYNPDVIGVQEALHHQLLDLVRLLPDYSYLGLAVMMERKKGNSVPSFFATVVLVY